MRLLSDPAPWWGVSSPSPYSIIDLIALDTVSPDVAGLLWWAVERGASVVVAAGPRSAGKTTLATTLFSFLPDDAAVYVTNGPSDSLDITAEDRSVWLFVNELSNHVPSYLFGLAARRAFDLVAGGVHIVAALHATSAEMIGIMLERDARVPAGQAKLIDLCIILTAERGEQGIIRRVTDAALLKDRAVPERVAAWSDSQRGLELTADGTIALGRWAGIEPNEAREEIRERAAYLVDTGRRGVHTREDVTAAVQHFRRSRGIQHGPA